jgi:hypothetical protein
MIVEKSRDSTSVEDPGYSKFRLCKGLRSGQGGSTTIDYGPDMVARVESDILPKHFNATVTVLVSSHPAREGLTRHVVPVRMII